MPTVQVPLSSDVMTNVDQTSVRDGNYQLFNATTDESGATVGLPGSSSFYTQLNSFTSSNETGALNPLITGMAWASKKNTLMVAVGQTITGLQLRNDPQPDSSLVTGTEATEATYGDAIIQRDPTGNSVIAPHVSVVGVSTYPNTYSLWGSLGTNPAKFMYDGDTKVYAVGGGVPVSATFTSTGFSVAGPTNRDVSLIANMPTTVTHVGYLDSYALMNSVGANYFQFSNVTDVSTWTASDLASAAGSEDNITALAIFNRRIYLFGRQSIEIWENDGVTPFSRVSGGFIEGGTVAPYSVVTANQSVFWLDATRRFATFSGSDVSYLTSPFDKELSSLPFVRDAQGYSCFINGDVFIFWDFPSAQKTYCVKLRGDNLTWSQVGRWNGDVFLGSSVTGWTSVPEAGITLCYNKGGSTLYALNPESRVDGPTGVPLRFARVTGHLDFGTHKRKLAKSMLIRLKRGHGTTTTTPYAVLRWRDNGEGPWTGERHIDLGRQGEREITAKLPRMGVFRTRQFELAVTDSVPVNIVSAEMDLEVLGA